MFVKNGDPFHWCKSILCTLFESFTTDPRTLSIGKGVKDLVLR